jgi:GAF domain-containing protein
MANSGPVDHFASIARSMQGQSSEILTLERAIEVAREVIEGCDHCGITIVKFGESIKTPVASSEVARRGDELQYELDEGPCLDATRMQQTTRSDDLLNESRWPNWAPRVSKELGVRSMLSLQLFTTGDNLGALNLYSETPNGFDEQDQSTALALAAHVAIALSTSQNIENGRTDLVNGALIGRAQGLLMERFSINAQQAFLLLHRISRESNTELLDVARELVDKPTPSPDRD